MKLFPSPPAEPVGFSFSRMIPFPVIVCDRVLTPGMKRDRTAFMIQSNQPLGRLNRPLSHRRARALALAGTGLLSLALAGGCADPLMRRSQLPETIDYSGGDTHQAPALPTQPATAPTAEILKPASLPAAPATVPSTLPAEGPATPATQPAEVSPATQPARPETTPSATTRPGL
jgi:hypothetical protein